MKEQAKKWLEKAVAVCLSIGFLGIVFMWVGHIVAISVLGSIGTFLLMIGILFGGANFFSLMLLDAFD